MVKRKYKRKTVKYKGITVDLVTSPYSVMATTVDNVGNMVGGMGKYPSQALKDLERVLKKKR